MNQKEKFILALVQVENIYRLIQNNQYTAFFSSHLISIKYELERQLALTNQQESFKIEK